jgi:hypothetical protein
VSSVGNPSMMLKAPGGGSKPLAKEAALLTSLTHVDISNATLKCTKLSM